MSCMNALYPTVFPEHWSDGVKEEWEGEGGGGEEEV